MVGASKMMDVIACLPKSVKTYWSHVGTKYHRPPAMKEIPLPILIFGASGHGCVAADAICASGQYKVAGFADADGGDKDCEVFGPLLGLDTDLPRILSQHRINHVFVALGDNWIRHEVVSHLRRTCPGVGFPTLIHPSASVGRNTAISEGALICSGAVIGVGASVGAFSIINTRASLDHHASMGDFTSLAPASATGGKARIEEGAAIGMGTMIHHKVTIGAWSVVGSGSVANRNIPAGSLAFGCPARVIRARPRNERYL